MLIARLLLKILVGCTMLELCLLATVNARSLEDILKSKEIHICISPAPGIATAEPSDCRENCTFKGIVYEEAMAFANSLGKDIKIKLLRVSWDEQFFNKDGKTIRTSAYTPELLECGQCDFYPNNVVKNDWRLKKLDFVTLFPSRMMVIVHKTKKKQFKNSQDLAGKIVAVQKDTSYHTWIQKQNKTQFIKNPIKMKFMPIKESLQAVDKGDADFSIIDSDAAIWSTRYQLKNSVAIFPVGATDEIGWAFRKKDKELQKTVETFFKDQRSRRNSEFNKIWKKEFGMTLNQFIDLMTTLK